MARAIVAGFVPTFGSLPDIQDDATNGWTARFQMVLTGSGVPGGFGRDEFLVHFLDTDAALAMDNKIRDAARARGVELGIAGAATMPVLSFLPPRRL